MSLQTTLARAEANAADDVWQRHRKGCHICEPVARKRRYDELCPDGKVALQVRDDLRAIAEREAELDKQPMPGEEPLFPLDVVAASTAATTTKPTSHHGR